MVPVDFASTDGCVVERTGWTEKFGEWITRFVARGFGDGSSITWTVDFKDPGVFNVDLEYLGAEKLEWKMLLDGKDALIDLHKNTDVFAWYRLGWVKVEEPGVHTFTLSLSDGDAASAKVASMRLTPVGL